MKKKEFIERYGIEAYERKLKLGREYAKNYQETHREETRLYARNYYKTHREQTIRYQKAHPEQIKNYKRKSDEKNSERRKKYCKKYYQNHQAERKEYNRKWYQEHKEYNIKQVRIWRKQHPESIKKYDAKKTAKRREKGFIPITEPISIDFDWHHVSKSLPYVIAVPREIHRSNLKRDEHCSDVNGKWLILASKNPQIRLKND